MDRYEELDLQLTSLNDTADELKSEFDEELMMIAEEEYMDMDKKFENFEIQVLLSHEYDQNNAILEIHPELVEPSLVTGQVCCIVCIQDMQKNMALK